MCEICGGKNYIALILVAKECLGNMSGVLARFIFLKDRKQCRFESAVIFWTERQVSRSVSVVSSLSNCL